MVMKRAILQGQMAFSTHTLSSSVNGLPKSFPTLPPVGHQANRVDGRKVEHPLLLSTSTVMFQNLITRMSFHVYSLL